ncbi:MAG TPA: hypothetical protein VF699_00050 [Caulobacteraceae bacterium]|jgi:hypothetical protein
MAGQTVSGRGKIVVAALVVVLVALAVVFGMWRTTGETTGRQGKLAPDSQEDVYGQGAPETKRSTPELNVGRGGELANTVTTDTGRNAPPAPGAVRQDAPTGSLTDGPNADPEKAAEPARQ